MINSVEKKTFERGRIGPVSKVFTTANGRPILLNLENSPKVKQLQVNQLWSSFRYLAKTSLFSAFFETEKIFLLNRKDFFSETNAICPEK